MSRDPPEPRKLHARHPGDRCNYSYAVRNAPIEGEAVSKKMDRSMLLYLTDPPNLPGNYHRQAYFEHGWACLESGDYGQAIQSATSVFSRDGVATDVAELFGRAMTLLERDWGHKGARKAYKHIDTPLLRPDPRDPAGLQLLRSAARARGWT